MKPFQFGIIGAGNIANRFCDAVTLVEDAKVVAVASNTPNKAKAFAETNNLERYYQSYEEMLKCDDIDAVYIATTHNFHYENLKLCIEHNKPVICEKAFVLTKAQAEEVFSLAKEKGVFVMEAMWSRFLPVINKAKEWIESGKLGEIDLATFIIGFKADNDPQNRMYNPKLAGGAMYDIGVYAIEIMTYLINEELKDVKSVITRHPCGNVDKVDAMILQFENCVATLNCIMTAGVQNELNIYGTNARIYIKDPHYSSECTLIDEKGVAETFYSRLDNGFEHQIKEVISCIKAGKLESSVIPHKDTIQCADIFDQCLGN
ncbi:Gfo/Idh/MocA family oxidoreductase [Paludicola sp. MB14-C6]|uniref:Gfo/Idh/MocA family protein n=1 Tax=Paludihabitans sp. MB14-C6 TaxID=3070656 RepID=UPI0027DCA8BE|nr:Gfo/Idh/MocA family oxidoreductase [Paludicola sp. MB14-C6]WMJ23596.1 Gfo/Idh/MocA family oxidoreductase [Paludicola sp. MB14-C6]